MLARFLRARAIIPQFTIAIRYAKVGAISKASKSNISKIRSAVIDKKSRAMDLESKKNQRTKLITCAKKGKQQKANDMLKQQRAKKSLLLAKRKETLKNKREKLKQQRAKKSLLLAKRKSVHVKRDKLKQQRAKKSLLLAKRKETLKNKREKLAEIKLKATTKSQRSKMLDKPWQGKGKLCTQPSLLYVSEKMKTYQRPAGESGLAAMQKFRKEYVALSTEQKAPYEATAAANRTARASAKSKVKGIHMSPYCLFMKENYHSVSSSLPGADGIAKMPLISKEIAQRWKSMSTEQKATYKVKADGIRADAKKNLNQLMQSK